jgi:hypothetical protein
VAPVARPFLQLASTYLIQAGFFASVALFANLLISRSQTPIGFFIQYASHCRGDFTKHLGREANEDQLGNVKSSHLINED